MIELIKNYLSEILKNYRFITIDSTDENTHVVNGSYRINRTILSEGYTINGEAILGDGVTVQKKMIINGTLVSKKVTFESDIEANGTSFFTDSKINGYAFLRGVSNACRSLFANTVNIISSESYFDQCLIDSIIIKQISSGNIIQKIYLTNDTIVRGNIEFESGIGQVYLGHSCVIKGKIIGGEINNKQLD